MNRQRKLFSVEHELFRDTVARFIAQEITPHHYQWEQEGLVPRELWRKAGAAGILLPSTPEEYGGSGGDFLHTIIVVEEIARYHRGYLRVTPEAARLRVSGALPLGDSHAALLALSAAVPVEVSTTARWWSTVRLRREHK